MPLSRRPSAPLPGLLLLLLLLVALAAIASLPAVSASAAGAAAAAAARASSRDIAASSHFPFYRRSLLQQNCDFTCGNFSSCLNVTCPVVNATQRIVTLDLSTCKNGGSISWVCCRTNACVPLNCSSGAAVSGGGTNFDYCSQSTFYTFSISTNTTVVPIQVHDGSLAKNYTCSGTNPSGAPGGCCAGGFNGGNNCQNGVQAYDGTRSVSNNFFTWFPLNGTSNNFGGYFRLGQAPSRVGDTFTSFNPTLIQPNIFMCAGCAGYQSSRGFYAGGTVLSVTEIASGVYNASCTITLVSSADTAVDAAFYAAFDPPPTNAPGQLNIPLPIVSPPLPVTGSSPPANSSFQLSKIVQGMPNSRNPSVYLACEMAVRICRPKNSTVVTAG
ncbi:hypothetical protein HYH02_006737 [Chlamydomonas schloesseri]|uniref:Peptidase A1 domain-containing protein n=1 Tax=Chlamydomonas schloesseri TaxID=2026947 RepID=A0A835WIH7_9CHLO|nr:hypothetical protein HYH02_006737 [Chlamydomonas schloesseri]|eukprot:KAG2448152.1 hypothetical protein HYH02_006737 [Chlamydomonas schloesseri]